MIKSRLPFLDPVLLARLRKNSRFNSIKTRLRSRLQALQMGDVIVPPHKVVKANGDHEPIMLALDLS